MFGVGVLEYLLLTLGAFAGGVAGGLMFAKAGLLLGVLSTLGLAGLMTTMAEALGPVLATGLSVEALIVGFVTVVINNDSG